MSETNKKQNRKKKSAEKQTTNVTNEDRAKIRHRNMHGQMTIEINV